jgi:hypothetical protein
VRDRLYAPLPGFVEYVPKKGIADLTGLTYVGHALEAKSNATAARLVLVYSFSRFLFGSQSATI